MVNFLISSLSSKKDNRQQTLLEVQRLQERKIAIQKELEEIDLKIKSILSKESLMAYDPVNNVYLLNVNYRA